MLRLKGAERAKADVDSARGGATDKSDWFDAAWHRVRTVSSRSAQRGDRLVGLGRDAKFALQSPPLRCVGIRKSEGILATPIALLDEGRTQALNILHHDPFHDALA